MPDRLCWRFLAGVSVPVLNDPLRREVNAGCGAASHDLRSTRRDQCCEFREGIAPTLAVALTPNRLTGLLMTSRGPSAQHTLGPAPQ